MLVNGRIVAIDFGCARFGEPPCEPYALVSPFILNKEARSLDLLSALKGVNPLFLFIYENIIRLGDGLRLTEKLQRNLLIDPLFYKDGTLVGTLSLPEAAKLLTQLGILLKSKYTDKEQLL